MLLLKKIMISFTYPTRIRNITGRFFCTSKKILNACPFDFAAFAVMGRLGSH